MKLNVGCGKRKMAGCVNCDIDPRVSPDLLFDISEGWPFRSDSVEDIVALSVLEHISADELIGTMREIHRVLKTGGALRAQVPYWTGRWSVADFRHKIFWNEHLLRWFCVPDFMAQAIAKDIDFHFDLTKLEFLFFPGVKEQWPTAEERTFARKHYLNIVDSMAFTLRKPE